MKKAIKEIKHDIIRLVLTLVVMTAFVVPAYGDVYFQDDFSTFTGWTYTTASTGHFDASGYLYLLDGQGVNGSTAAYKLFDIDLPPSDDFSFVAHIKSGPDSSNTCGWINMMLLDSSDKIVAEMEWHDVQASTGYGGVDFYGEGKTAIYRTAPSGFGTEYPIFPTTGEYGTLMLKRSASEWSAWVNETQKGLTLTLSPTLTATKIQIEMGTWSLWNERVIRVDDIAVVPAPGAILLGSIGLAFSSWKLRRQRAI